ncbi:MAG: radical SAM family heme chaperone HemW [Nitrospirota bacterium]|nr:radical SAM family heme chaperone HemW [Nitrospirota bacterium]
MLSLYIHIPFCRAKCRYCGFYSTPYDPVVADLYLKALKRELTAYVPKLGPTPVATIYLGGGTPSILSPAQLEELFAVIRSAMRLEPNIEITVETNPDSLSKEVLGLLKDQGVNRLSIGVQSFSDAVLRWLRRPHSAQQAQDALALSRSHGFSNINIDLIYGIPGLTTQTWCDTIKKAIDFIPEHIAAYSLSLDEGSMLRREHEEGTLVLPDDDLVVQQYQEAIEILEQKGYQHYEISNFSLPSFACRHNLNYWQRGEYLGLGPAAWSFLNGKRTMNIADIGSYLSRIETGGQAYQFEEIPSKDESFLEYLALGLRLSCGVDQDTVASRFGEKMRDRLLERVHRLDWTGFFSIDGRSVRLTHRGRLLSNDAVARIVS